MTSYSHSKIGTFQQCKYKYKLQYIDKIKVDTPDTIETFMGKLVHETLEKLYKDLKYQKKNTADFKTARNYQRKNTKEELLSYFEDKWLEKWNDLILIVKKDYTSSNYLDMGKKCISDYYDHYTPFTQTITL